jgi:enoyl-CoA hydratase/carnithine racemase
MFSKKNCSEIGYVFDLLATDTDCRSIVVSAVGPVFCAGLDFTSMAEFGRPCRAGSAYPLPHFQAA